MYTYEGIRKLTREDVIRRYKEGKLIGCLKLFSDDTECYIEEIEWNDIIEHMDSGGEIGFEV